jgi:hypothetical protein
MKFTYVGGTSIINGTVPPFSETLFADRVKLFAQVVALHARCVSARRRPQNGVLELYPSGAKKMEVGGCKMGTVWRMRENSPPRFCNCLPCAHTGVRFGVAMQGRALTDLPVWAILSNSLL